MERVPKSSILILVLGLIISIVVSMKMRKARVDEYGIGTKEQASMVYVPFFGIDKFWADISWMRALNQMGGIQQELTEANADYFHDQFQRITDLDPDFDLIYKVGAPFIAHKRVDKAISLVEKGEKYSLEKDWNRPYLAAHWIIQVKARNAADEEKKKEFQSQAVDFLERAIDDGSQPWYVESMLLRLQSKITGKADDPLSELEAWNEYYQARLSELAEPYATAAPEGGEPGAPMPMTDPAVTGHDMLAGDTNLGRLRERIIKRCRNLMLDLLEKGEETKAQQARVRAVFAQMDIRDHYSPLSLKAYEPGDLFDSVTGEPVVPYGIDLYDYEVNARITPYKGAHNVRTGKPAAEDFAKLEALLSKEGKKITRLAAHRPEAVKPQ